MTLLVHLERMPALKELDLSYTPIADRGLSHLEGLVSLDEPFAFEHENHGRGARGL